MRSIISLSLLLGSSTVFAHWYEPDSGPGAGPPNTSFAEANRNPDISKSVTFQPVADGTSWSWHVNITKIPVNDSTSPPRMVPAAYTGSDAQVVNVVYSFSWDDGNDNSSITQELDDNMAQTSEPFCVNPIEMYSLLPPNVTNLYNDTADPSGLCATTIGQACIDGLRNATLADTRDVRGCRGRNLNLTAIPECRGNLPLEWYTFGFPYPLNNPSNMSNASSRLFQNETYRNGDAFQHISSSTDNSTGIQDRFNMEQFRVHMLLVDAGGADTFNALCMRVNTSVVATDDASTGAESAAIVSAANAWLSVGAALMAILTCML